jgi:hypothetical protein
VPFGVAVNTHSCTPVMPSPVSPHKTRDWSRAAYTVEVTVKPKLVQVNDAPGAKAPFSGAAVISDCQAGQVDVQVQRPDPAHRSADVNLMMRQDRRVAVDAGRSIHR